jgi:cytidylate kinase
MTQGPVVAIDGPAGAGKSTVASATAARLGLPHIDTGAIYRAITLKALETGTLTDDGMALGELADRTLVEVVGEKVILDGKDVTREIRRADVTAEVSRVSSHPEVRSRMIQLQRAMVGEDGAVVEGRDIGTVVLTDANIKIFLTADPQERARRRATELEASGIAAGKVLEEILERDRSDSERPNSPLAIAEGAHVIDSTGRSVESIVDEIERLVSPGSPPNLR